MLLSVPIKSVHVRDVLVPNEVLLRPPPPMTSSLLATSTSSSSSSSRCPLPLSPQNPNANRNDTTDDNSLINNDDKRENAKTTRLSSPTTTSLLHVWDHLTLSQRNMLEDTHGFLFTTVSEVISIPPKYYSSSSSSASTDRRAAAATEEEEENSVPKDFHNNKTSSSRGVGDHEEKSGNGFEEKNREEKVRTTVVPAAVVPSSSSVAAGLFCVVSALKKPFKLFFAQRDDDVDGEEEEEDEEGEEIFAYDARSDRRDYNYVREGPLLITPPLAPAGGCRKDNFYTHRHSTASFLRRPSPPLSTKTTPPIPLTPLAQCSSTAYGRRQQAVPLSPAFVGDISTPSRWLAHKKEREGNALFLEFGEEEDQVEVERRRLHCLVIPEGYFVTFDAELCATTASSTAASSTRHHRETTCTAGLIPLITRSHSPCVGQEEEATKNTLSLAAALTETAHVDAPSCLSMSLPLPPSRATVCIDADDCVFGTITIRRIARSGGHTKIKGGGRGGDSDGASVSQRPPPDLASLHWLNVLGLSGKEEDEVVLRFELTCHVREVFHFYDDDNDNDKGTGNNKQTPNGCHAASNNAHKDLDATRYRNSSSTDGRSCTGRCNNNNNNNNKGIVKFPLYFKDITGMDIEKLNDDAYRGSSTTAEDDDGEVELLFGDGDAIGKTSGEDGKNAKNKDASEKKDKLKEATRQYNAIVSAFSAFSSQVSSPTSRHRPSSTLMLSCGLTRLGPLSVPIRSELFDRPFSSPTVSKYIAPPHAVKAAFKEWSREQQDGLKLREKEERRRVAKQEKKWKRRMERQNTDDDNAVTAGTAEGGGLLCEEDTDSGEKDEVEAGQLYDYEVSAAFYALRKEASARWRTLATVHIELAANTSLLLSSSQNPGKEEDETNNEPITIAIDSSTTHENSAEEEEAKLQKCQQYHTLPTSRSSTPSYFFSTAAGVNTVNPFAALFFSLASTFSRDGGGGGSSPAIDFVRVAMTKAGRDTCASPDHDARENKKSFVYVLTNNVASMRMCLNPHRQEHFQLGFDDRRNISISASSTHEAAPSSFPTFLSLFPLLLAHSRRSDGGEIKKRRLRGEGRVLSSAGDGGVGREYRSPTMRSVTNGPASEFGAMLRGYCEESEENRSISPSSSQDRGGGNALGSSVDKDETGYAEKDEDEACETRTSADKDLGASNASCTPHEFNGGGGGDNKQSDDTLTFITSHDLLPSPHNYNNKEKENSERRSYESCYSEEVEDHQKQEQEYSEQQKTGSFPLLRSSRSSLPPAAENENEKLFALSTANSTMAENDDVQSGAESTAGDGEGDQPSNAATTTAADHCDKNIPIDFDFSTRDQALSSPKEGGMHRNPASLSNSYSQSFTFSFVRAGACSRAQSASEEETDGQHGEQRQQHDYYGQLQQLLPPHVNVGVNRNSYGGAEKEAEEEDFCCRPFERAKLQTHNEEVESSFCFDVDAAAAKKTNGVNANDTYTILPLLAPREGTGIPSAHSDYYADNCNDDRDASKAVVAVAGESETAEVMWWPPLDYKGGDGSFSAGLVTAATPPKANSFYFGSHSTNLPELDPPTEANPIYTAVISGQGSHTCTNGGDDDVLKGEQLTVTASPSLHVHVHLDGGHDDDVPAAATSIVHDNITKTKGSTPPLGSEDGGEELVVAQQSSHCPSSPKPPQPTIPKDDPALVALRECEKLILGQTSPSLIFPSKTSQTLFLSVPIHNNPTTTSTSPRENKRTNRVGEAKSKTKSERRTEREAAVVKEFDDYDNNNNEEDDLVGGAAYSGAAHLCGSYRDLHTEQHADRRDERLLDGGGRADQCGSSGNTRNDVHCGVGPLLRVHAGIAVDDDDDHDNNNKNNVSSSSHGTSLALHNKSPAAFGITFNFKRSQADAVLHHDDNNNDDHDAAFGDDDDDDDGCGAVISAECMVDAAAVRPTIGGVNTVKNKTELFSHTMAAKPLCGTVGEFCSVEKENRSNKNYSLLCSQTTDSYLAGHLHHLQQQQQQTYILNTCIAAIHKKPTTTKTIMKKTTPTTGKQATTATEAPPLWQYYLQKDDDDTNNITKATPLAEKANEDCNNKEGEDEDDYAPSPPADEEYTPMATSNEELDNHEANILATNQAAEGEEAFVDRGRDDAESERKRSIVTHALLLASEDLGRNGEGARRRKSSLPMQEDQIEQYHHHQSVNHRHHQPTPTPTPPPPLATPLEPSSAIFLSLAEKIPVETLASASEGLSLIASNHDETKEARVSAWLAESTTVIAPCLRGDAKRDEKNENKRKDGEEIDIKGEVALCTPLEPPTSMAMAIASAYAETSNTCNGVGSPHRATPHPHNNMGRHRRHNHPRHHDGNTVLPPLQQANTNPRSHDHNLVMNSVARKLNMSSPPDIPLPSSLQSNDNHLSLNVKPSSLLRASALAFVVGEEDKEKRTSTIRGSFPFEEGWDTTRATTPRRSAATTRRMQTSTLATAAFPQKTAEDFAAFPEELQSTNKRKACGRPSATERFFGFRCSGKEEGVEKSGSGSDEDQNLKDNKLFLRVASHTAYNYSNCSGNNNSVNINNNTKDSSGSAVVCDDNDGWSLARRARRSTTKWGRSPPSRATATSLLHLRRATVGYGPRLAKVRLPDTSILDANASADATHIASLLKMETFEFSSGGATTRAVRNSAATPTQPPHMKMMRMNSFYSSALRGREGRSACTTVGLDYEFDNEENEKGDGPNGTIKGTLSAISEMVKRSANSLKEKTTEIMSHAAEKQKQRGGVTPTTLSPSSTSRASRGLLVENNRNTCTHTHATHTSYGGGDDDDIRIVYDPNVPSSDPSDEYMYEMKTKKGGKDRIYLNKNNNQNPPNTEGDEVEGDLVSLSHAATAPRPFSSLRKSNQFPLPPDCKPSFFRRRERALIGQRTPTTTATQRYFPSPSYRGSQKQQERPEVREEHHRERKRERSTTAPPNHRRTQCYVEDSHTNNKEETSACFSAKAKNRIGGAKRSRMEEEKAEEESSKENIERNNNNDSIHELERRHSNNSRGGGLLWNTTTEEMPRKTAKWLRYEREGDDGGGERHRRTSISRGKEERERGQGGGNKPIETVRRELYKAVKVVKEDESSSPSYRSKPWASPAEKITDELMTFLRRQAEKRSMRARSNTRRTGGSGYEEAQSHSHSDVNARGDPRHLQRFPSLDHLRRGGELLVSSLKRSEPTADEHEQLWSGHSRLPSLDVGGGEEGEGMLIADKPFSLKYSGGWGGNNRMLQTSPLLFSSASPPISSSSYSTPPNALCRMSAVNALNERLNQNLAGIHGSNPNTCDVSGTTFEVGARSSRPTSPSYLVPPSQRQQHQRETTKVAAMPYVTVGTATIPYPHPPSNPSSHFYQNQNQHYGHNYHQQSHSSDGLEGRPLLPADGMGTPRQRAHLVHQVHLQSSLGHQQHHRHQNYHQPQHHHEQQGQCQQQTLSSPPLVPPLHIPAHAHHHHHPPHCDPNPTKSHPFSSSLSSPSLNSFGHQPPSFSTVPMPTPPCRCYTVEGGPIKHCAAASASPLCSSPSPFCCGFPSASAAAWGHSTVGGGLSSSPPLSSTSPASASTSSPSLVGAAHHISPSGTSTWPHLPHTCMSVAPSSSSFVPSSSPYCGSHFAAAADMAQYPLHHHQHHHCLAPPY